MQLELGNGMYARAIGCSASWLARALFVLARDLALTPGTAEQLI
jgi:hypothetical protein